MKEPMTLGIHLSQYVYEETRRPALAMGCWEDKNSCLYAQIEGKSAMPANTEAKKEQVVHVDCSTDLHVPRNLSSKERCKHTKT